jgi:hypothetical protein
MLWFIYGLLIHNLQIVVVNMVGFILQACYTLLYLAYTQQRVSSRPLPNTHGRVRHIFSLKEKALASDRLRSRVHIDRARLRVLLRRRLQVVEFGYRYFGERRHNRHVRLAFGHPGSHSVAIESVKSQSLTVFVLTEISDRHSEHRVHVLPAVSGQLCGRVRMGSLRLLSERHVCDGMFRPTNASPPARPHPFPCFSSRFPICSARYLASPKSPCSASIRRSPSRLKVNSRPTTSP